MLRNVLALTLLGTGVTCAQGQAAALQAQAPDGAAATFDVLEIRVLGNSVLPSIEVEKAVYPFTGPAKTVKDMDQARAALETAYHSAGFATVFVDLPEQTIDDGIVRIRVTQGRLQTVHATGAKYFSERRIRAAVPEANAGTVPNFPKLQQELAQFNADNPGRSVTPVLKSGSQPGTVDLTLRATDQLPLHASVELNNQQTENTRPIRALISLSYSDLFGRLDELSLQYQDTPQQHGQVGVFAANLAMHLYDGGPPLSIYYINSKTDVATVGTLGVLGKGSIFGLRLVDTLENRERVTSSLTLGIDYKHFLQAINVDANTSLNTPNSYVNFSAAYASVWRSEPRTWNADIAANFGSRQIVNDADHFALARYRGRPNFFYLHGGGSVNQVLPWGMHLSGRISGQAAFEPLISNEYFSIAGSDGVRGYLEAEQFGDVGIKGSLQLAGPQLRAFEGDLSGNVFAFFDDGRVTFLASLPGQPGHAVLRSAGAGLELISTRHFTGSLTWAYPLVDAPMTHSGASKLLFIVRSSF